MSHELPHASERHLGFSNLLRKGDVSEMQRKKTWISSTVAANTCSA
jgi:hypothetical protein